MPPQEGKRACEVLKDLGMPAVASRPNTSASESPSMGMPYRGHRKGKVVSLLQTQVRVQEEVLQLQGAQLQFMQDRKQARKDKKA